MIRPFDRLNQVFDCLVAGSQPGADRQGCHNEWLAPFSIAVRQTLAEKIVHGGFEGGAGAAQLLPYQSGYVVVEGESGSHIMMLSS